MGKKLVENLDSEADLTEFLKDQAQVLYPWKDREIATQTAAEPWMTTFSRVLEQPMPDIYNPRIQQALTAGQPIYDFEKTLRQSDDWKQTMNFRQTMTNAVAMLGEKMGF